MTEKQKRFCDEYLTDLNATRAYKAVYTRVKNDDTAAACASKLLRNAKVVEYIKSELEALHSDKIADVDEIMRYLTSVLRGEQTDEVLIWTGDGVQDKTNTSVATRDKLKAAELLGKRYGMFTDKVQLDGVSRVIFEGEDALE